MINKIDILICSIIALFMLIGYCKGLIKTVFSLVQYFAVIFLSIFFTPIFSDILIDKFDLKNIILIWIKNNEVEFLQNVKLLDERILANISERIINVITFLILFLVLKIVFMLIIMTLNKIADLPIINTVNKLGGTIIGGINGILISYVIVLVINWIPISSTMNLKEELNSSILGNKISYFVPRVANNVVDLVNEEVSKEKGK